jgi:selenocysteine-specific translation elongation factor
MNRVLDNAPKASIILVLTQSDTLDPNVVAERQGTRAEFARSYNAKKFVITAAKTGEGIPDLLRVIADCPAAEDKVKEPERVFDSCAC